ncbi:MAG TPA: ATP-binding protein [Accumulibacter sp.]|nr:ATP-binding protein [Accumulibacter sp.]
MTQTDTEWSQQRLAAQMLRFAYARLLLSIVLSIAVTLLFINVLFPYFRHDLLWRVVWVIVAANLCRLGLWFCYRQAKPADENTASWATWFFISSTAAAAAWSFAVVLLLDGAGGSEMAFLVVWIIAVTSVASISLSAHLPSVISFVVTALLPIGTFLLIDGNGMVKIVGLAVYGSLITLGLTAYSNYSSTRKILLGDIERSAALAEAAAARQAAEAGSQAKSDFLATMSHEIRTPINGIIGMTEMLRASGLNSQQQRFADTAHQSGQHLLAIISDILDFSKVEAGKLELEHIPFNLHELIDSINALFMPIANSKGLQLLCQVSSDLPDRVVGDPVRLRQILSNLINNAIKFTPRGKVSIRAHFVRRHSEMAVCRFEVEDNGVGISEQAQGYLFKAFVQADSSTTRRFGGSGLGLVIAKRLLDLMGGQIGLKSQLGLGTLFWFELPLGKPATNLQPRTKMATLHENRPNPAKFRGRVLVAEDNPVNQAVVSAMLESLGVTYELADNGRIAIERLRHASFDLLLMDCQMPEMDGFSATAAIRDRERASRASRRLPIMALTANAVAGDRERCLAAGMDDYLSKPFTREQLASALARWLKIDSSSSVACGSKPITPPATLPVLNPTPLNKLRQLPPKNGVSPIVPVIEAYLADAPQQWQRLRTATDVGDQETLRHAAHNLTSSSANVGADRLSALARELEIIAHSRPVEEAKPLLSTFERELTHVLAALATLK